MSTRVIEPKFSSPTFRLKPSTYVVTNGQIFSYYAIKIEDETTEAPIFRFKQSPPVIRDGVVAIKKKLYFVTTKDLVRGIVRKSREIGLEELTGNDRTAITEQSNRVSSSENGDSSGTALPSEDQSGASEFATLEINEANDSLEPEQVRALHDLVLKEEGKAWGEWAEEWEISDHP